METSEEKKENPKPENKSEANSNAKKEEATWWENIAKDNPQFGTVIKALSNPLLSAGSIVGLIYTMNVSKTAKQAAEGARKESEKVKSEYSELADECKKLKKKHKKLKKNGFSTEGKIDHVGSPLHGNSASKNPMYKTSYLD